VEAWIVPEYRLTFELERRLGLQMPARYAALARRRLGALARDVVARRHALPAVVPAPVVSASGGTRVEPARLDWGFGNGDDATPTEVAPIPTQPYASPDAPTPPEPLPVRHDEPPALETLAAWAQLAAAPSRDAIFAAL